MTAWVADYVSRISPADLRAAGVVGVCRYLADTTSIGKIIGQAEYDELRAAGIGVLLNWEQDELDWLGGAAKGSAHAGSAVRQARALGYPAGSVIVGSADFNMSSSQWSGYGRAYAVAFRDTLNGGGYGAGVYGPYDVLTWVRQLGGYRVYWQAGMSTAWSAGRNASLWPGAHLRQRRHVTVGGHDTDYNDIVQSDWQGDAMTPQQQYYQYVMHYRLDAILHMRPTCNVPAFTATDGSKFPAISEGNQLAAAITALGGTAGHDLTAEEIQALADAVAAQVHVPTAQETAEAVADELHDRIAE